MYVCAAYRGCLFRGLRNLREDVVYDILCKVKCREVQITSLNSECKKIKKMVALRKAFCKSVGVECWENAVEDFPSYTSTEITDKFLFNQLSSNSSA